MFTYVLGNAVGAATTVSLNRRLRRDGGDPGALLRDAMAETGLNALLDGLRPSAAGSGT